METVTPIEKSCCFTGHRDLPAELYDDIYKETVVEIKRLYGLGVRRFIAGGALGYDMLCAEAVVGLKAELEGITLILALPCRGHDRRWSLPDSVRLFKLQLKADETVYVSEEYTKYCMFKRNRYMVDRSLYCISYCTKNTGGSYYTVNYAKSLEREITEISERVI